MTERPTWAEAVADIIDLETWRETSGMVGSRHWYADIEDRAAVNVHLHRDGSACAVRVQSNRHRMAAWVSVHDVPAEFIAERLRMCAEAVATLEAP